jgi:hypothetical protein
MAGAAAEASAAGLRLRDGTSFSFELVRSAKSSARTEIGSGVVTGDGMGYRVLFDTKGGRFFGYAVKAMRLPNRRFRLELGPLTPETLARLAKDFEEDEGRKLVGESLPIDLPAPLVVGDDEPVMLELMENPTTREKLTDVIRVKSNEPERPDRLRVSNARVSINGKALSDTGGASGRYVWFALPGKGRFLFSAEAVEGFEFIAAELVDNRIIRFTANGDTYEWASALPIVQTPPVLRSLWVWHDSEFRVRGDFAVGANHDLPSR